MRPQAKVFFVIKINDEFNVWKDGDDKQGLKNLAFVLTDRVFRKPFHNEFTILLIARHIFHFTIFLWNKGIILFHSIIFFGNKRHLLRPIKTIICDGQIGLMHFNNKIGIGRNLSFHPTFYNRIDPKDFFELNNRNYISHEDGLPVISLDNISRSSMMPLMIYNSIMLFCMMQLFQVKDTMLSYMMPFIRKYRVMLYYIQLLFRMKDTMQSNMFKLYTINGIMLQKSIRVIVLKVIKPFTSFIFANISGMKSCMPLLFITIIIINY